jgi:adenylate cyclase
VTVETVKAHKRLAREEVARANYSRFMPEYVVKQLLDNPSSFKLGGINQKITVLFADIRGFTSISEKEKPEKVVGLLNKFFSAMTDIIFENGGTLDKYIGDGLMALFGGRRRQRTLNSVKAAVTMQKKLRDKPRMQRACRKFLWASAACRVALIGWIAARVHRHQRHRKHCVRLQSNTGGARSW